jgi:hypothetical protein
MTTIGTPYHVWNGQAEHVVRSWPRPSLRFSIFAMSAIVAGAVMAFLT